MKNIYFVQANDVYGERIKSIYIPYASGCIAAYAWEEERVKENYKLKRIIYQREDIDEAIASLENPYLVAFSCYEWNHEYNRAFAKALKEKYPSTLVVFGGHDVAPDFSEFEECPAVDILCYREGESSFRQLLLCLLDKKSLDSIDNIAFRRDDKYVMTQEKLNLISEFPSPYLNGIFDEILKDDIKFSGLLETNRGCPNACAYCDWGTLGTRVRLFSMERVKAELNWFVENKIEYIFCADGNFGLFDRDEEIADYIINLKVTTGYPQNFRVCFTKNRSDFVRKIGKKFNEYGLDKAQTLSFQSLSEEVLNNIGRKNIKLDHFRELMTLYKKINIATFSELIIGLPGETRQSFFDGLCTLLEYGQHDSILVYPCELLPNSALGTKENILKFGIKSEKVPFRQVHARIVPQKNEITEYCRFIFETKTMTSDDWVECVVVSSLIQALHNMGLIRFISIFVRNDCNISYKDFYSEFIKFSVENKETICGKAFNYVSELAKGVVKGTNPWVVPYEPLGDISWRFEEIYFVKCFEQIEEFYEEIGRFISKFGINEDVKNALLCYQNDILKKIKKHGEIRIESDYDFYNYFNRIYIDEYAPLEKVKTRVTVNDGCITETLKDYAREVVWYGRNHATMLYSSSYYKPEIEHI